MKNVFEKKDRLPLALAACLWAVQLAVAAGLPLPGAAGAVYGVAAAAAVALLGRGVFVQAAAVLPRGQLPGSNLAAVAWALCAGCGVYGVAVGGDGALAFATADGVLIVAMGSPLVLGRAAARLEALAPAAPGLPATANILRDGKPTKLPAGELETGEIFLVRTGETLPADGTVLEGSAVLDESPLTGQDAPAEKLKGDAVHAGTVCRSGALACRADRTGGQVDLCALGRMARPGAGMPLQAARCALAAIALVAAVALAAWWAVAGAEAGLMRAAAVLAVGCPVAFACAGSAANAAGAAVGAKHGIYAGTPAALEKAAALRAALVEPEGVLTTGAPAVVEIVGTRNVPPKFLLGMAAGLLAPSRQPEAHAVLRRAARDGVRQSKITDFASQPGRGSEGKLAGKLMAGGSRPFIEERCTLTPDLAGAGERMEAAGVTPLYFALDGHPAGVIGIGQAMRPNCEAALARLRALGVDPWLPARGDAARVAAQTGVDAGHLAPGADAAQSLDWLAAQTGAQVAAVACGLQAGALPPAPLAVVAGLAQGPAHGCEGQACLLLAAPGLDALPDAVSLARGVQTVAAQNRRAALGYHLVALPLAALLPLPLAPVAGAVAAVLLGARGYANALRLSAFVPQATQEAAHAEG